MQAPHIKNSIRDEEFNTTYHIMAYRDLSYEEMVKALRVYYSSTKKKKKEKNKEITIVTVIGIAQ